ncbi:MAG: quinone-dependent dihydroorotate dehydrogenase [Pseudohongiellaceae bacterium]
MYLLMRNLLFLLPAESSHHVALVMMGVAKRLGLLGLIAARTRGLQRPVTVMGLTFPNPIGLAAGLDKNADYIDALGSLGFGFIEVGTLTPRPQPGNRKPRLFRLRSRQAIINRMGFNNKGIDHAMERIAASHYRGILGINIGKNFDTPVENAAEDYVHCLQSCYAHASYVTVNLSSPNTPGLRDLQFGSHLDALLQRLMQSRAQLQQQHRRYVPLAIKLSPDLTSAEVLSVGRALLAHKVDAIVATNTTMDKEAVSGDPLAAEAGGLSGKPLAQKSTDIIAALKSVVGDRIPIIGVGGIMDAEDALKKLRAGASLLQLYTGFIFSGPPLITKILEALQKQDDVTNH